MTAASRYEALCKDREPYITRARKHAKVTIPHLFTEQGSNASTTLYTPYQSIGARGVNNLSAKLMLALFPPNTSSFRLVIDDLALQNLARNAKIKGEVEASLSKIEQKALTDLETSPFRSTVSEVMKQLIVAGNMCLYMPKNPKEMRAFRLDKYVVKRSPSGMVLLAIIKECVSKKTLSQAILDEIKDSKGASSEVLPSSKSTDSETEDVFTVIEYSEGQYKVHQEICGVAIESTKGSYNPDDLPYIFLRMNKVDGEDYGRGYVEDYYGDLFTLENLSEALVSGSIVMSKIIFLVDPAGTTRPEDLSQVENGGFVDGNKNDISILQADKLQDLSYIRQHAAEIEKRLSFAFLLNTSIQRSGERVTAEEIRIMARELEDGLGGTYSTLAQEFQYKVAVLQLSRLQRGGLIPKLPKEVKPMVVTGIEAIGRGQDLQKLREFASVMKETFGPQVQLDQIEFGKRVGASLGINTDGLVPTPEDLAMQQANGVMAGMAPDALKAATQLAAKSMENQNG